MKKEFIENIDYYRENGFIIMTEHFHKKRGYCCGSGCLHCAYEPKHIKNNTTLKPQEDKKEEDK
jgi:hypothetical protein